MNSQYNIIFWTNFSDKFGFTINYNETILQWVDHEISLKDPNEFFGNNMIVELNYKICQVKDVNMFDQKRFDSHAVHILDAKYEQVDTNGVAANKK